MSVRCSCKMTTRGFVSRDPECYVHGVPQAMSIDASPRAGDLLDPFAYDNQNGDCGLFSVRRGMILGRDIIGINTPPTRRRNP